MSIENDDTYRSLLQSYQISMLKTVLLINYKTLQSQLNGIRKWNYIVPSDLIV